MHGCKKILLFILACLASGASARAQNQRAFGWCTQGGVNPTVVGLPLQDPTNTVKQNVQASWPGCTVNVFLAGTITPATIFADTLNTPKSNPFTADLTTGFWFFYAATGRYDVQLSGGGIPAPFTLGDISINAPGSGIVVPGGSPIQTQVNNGGAFAGTPCQSFADLNLGPEFVDCDFHTKGPNPSVDVTRYGVRNACTSAVPCVPGITATITATQTTATLSSASTFKNGDGVTIFGAGATNTLSTPAAPTVSPALASAGIATGFVAAGPTGATTYNYKIVARRTGGGLTAASTAGTTTTGPASLGVQFVAITTLSRTGTTVTVTTSSAHTAAVGGEIQISGISVAWNGRFTVVTVPDSTHLTFTGTIDTGGPTVTASGGNLTWWNCVHLSWTKDPGAYLYYIFSDRGSPGTFNLVGFSRPMGSYGAGDTPTWDDFGAVAPTVEFYVPTTAPSVATNDNLVTTIVSGATTTTLTLFNSAVNSVTNATILFDNAPNIVAADNAAFSLGGMLYFPAGQTFITNSFLDLSINSQQVAVSVGGSLWLNDSWQLPKRVFGDLVVNPSGPTSFAQQARNAVSLNRSAVGFYNGSPTSSVIRGLQIVASNKGTRMVFLTSNAGAAAAMAVDQVVFIQNLGDTTGIPLEITGPVASTAGPFDVHVRDVTLEGTQGLSMSAPGFFCANCLAYAEIKNVNTSGSTFFVTSQGSGAQGEFYIRGGRAQGPNNALVETLGHNVISIEDYDIDTGTHELASSFGNNNNLTITNSGGGVPTVAGSGWTSVVLSATGDNSPSNPGQTSVGGVSNKVTQLVGGTVTTLGAGGGISAGGTSAIGFFMPIPAAPNVVVGGSGTCASNCVAAGTWYYSSQAVDITGRDSFASAQTSATVDGTQTVTVTMTPVNGQITLNPCRTVTVNNPATTFCAFNSSVPTQGCLATSYVDGTNAPVGICFGNTYTNSGVGGNGHADGMSASGTNVTNLIFTSPGFKDTFNGTFTTNRTVTVPDASGGLLLSTSSTPSLKFLDCQTTTTCSQTSVSSPVIQIKGGPIALVAGTITITSLPFTSSTSYVCTASDSTSSSTGVEVTYNSGSSVTFSGTSTDTIRYHCWGT